MSPDTVADQARIAALGLPTAVRMVHVGSVAEASSLLTEAASAGAELLWLHGGADLGYGPTVDVRGRDVRWLAVVRPMRRCEPIRPDASLVDVGGGRLWSELDASLRRRGAQLGRWQEHVGTLPVGAVLGRSADRLDHSAREGWRVLAATCVLGNAIVELDNPSEAQLARADAILDVRLSVQPLRRASGRQFWRFPDAMTALQSLQTLGPELMDGLGADLAPAVGLRRGAVWTRAADDGSTWRTALAASLPGAAAFLDRRLRLAERRGWWLRLVCDGEPGLVEVRLAGCGAVLRELGGHLDSHAATEGLGDWWPDAQPLVPQVARARGASATWFEQQLDWASIARTLESTGASRAWLQVGDGDAVGARLQQWCIEESPLMVLAAESGGQDIGRAIGPKLRATLQQRRRSGICTPAPEGAPGRPPAVWAPLGSSVSSLPAHIEHDLATGCLWTTASTPWRACAGHARSIGRTLAASNDAPEDLTVGTLVRLDVEARSWLRARATPWPRRWLERVVRACGVVATDGSLVLPRRAAPSWVGTLLGAGLDGSSGQAGHTAPSRGDRGVPPTRSLEVWAVGLRTEAEAQPRRLWWQGTRGEVWRAIPQLTRLATGADRFGVLLDGDVARVCVEVSGSGARARRTVDFIAGLLRGLRDDPTPWPTTRLLDAVAVRVPFDEEPPFATLALVVDDERWALALLPQGEPALTSASATSDHCLEGGAP